MEGDTSCYNGLKIFEGIACKTTTSDWKGFAISSKNVLGETISPKLYTETSVKIEPSLTPQLTHIHSLRENYHETVSYKFVHTITTM